MSFLFEIGNKENCNSFYLIFKSHQRSRWLNQAAAELADSASNEWLAQAAAESMDADCNGKSPWCEKPFDLQWHGVTWRKCWLCHRKNVPHVRYQILTGWYCDFFYCFINKTLTVLVDIFEKSTEQHRENHPALSTSWIWRAVLLCDFYSSSMCPSVSLWFS